MRETERERDVREDMSWRGRKKIARRSACVICTCLVEVDWENSRADAAEWGEDGEAIECGE